jgi:hypothetical protein
VIALEATALLAGSHGAMRTPTNAEDLNASATTTTLAHWINATMKAAVCLKLLIAMTITAALWMLVLMENASTWIDVLITTIVLRSVVLWIAILELATTTTTLAAT